MAGKAAPDQAMLDSLVSSCVDTSAAWGWLAPVGWPQPRGRGGCRSVVRLLTRLPPPSPHLIPTAPQMAGDFDPEAYDWQMAAAFGDDYYGTVRLLLLLCLLRLLLCLLCRGILFCEGAQPAALRALLRCTHGCAAHRPPALRAVLCQQGADEEEDEDLQDELFEKELEVIAQVGGSLLCWGWCS